MKKGIIVEASTNRSLCLVIMRIPPILPPLITISHPLQNIIK
jgi:hypothetical protein